MRRLRQAPSLRPRPARKARRAPGDPRAAGASAVPGTETDSGNGQSPGQGIQREAPHRPPGCRKSFPRWQRPPPGFQCRPRRRHWSACRCRKQPRPKAKLWPAFPRIPSGFLTEPLWSPPVFPPRVRSLQVTADAISAAGQDSVVGHFQQQLAKLNFWSEPAPAGEGQRAVRFVRGADSMTLTTSATGTGSTRFMLFGNLHTTAG